MIIQDQDDRIDVDSLTILLEEPEEGVAAVVEENAAEQQHHLLSIDSTVMIRQLPSQGLSFQLWPAATTLVTLLDQHHQQPNNSPLSSIFSDRGRPLRILELGSGTGLVGIAAAAILGENVTLTDLPHVLPNIQFNAMLNSTALSFNGGTVNVASLRWGEVEDMESIGREFDILLGSDVVYHDHLFDPLLQTLRFFLNKDNHVVFVMAHLRRWKKESVFFKKARKMFRVEMIHSDRPSPGSRIGVVVYTFAGKGQSGMLAPQAQTMSVPS